MTRRGFTLIELIVVFAVIGVLTALGIASYSSFNGTQILSSSASDAAAMLNTAKSRAIAQVIPNPPGSCASNSLSGYQVRFLSNSYTLSAFCGTNQDIVTNKLPANVTFTTIPAVPLFFSISTGIVTKQTTPVTIIMSGYGTTKKIIVSSTGSIAIQ